MLMAVLIGSLLAGCIGGGDDEGGDSELSGTISIAGSTTVQPIASAAAEAFMEMHPDVTVTVQGGGSGTGVTQVAQGTVDIGNASREVKPSEMEEYPGLVPTAVAADGIAVVTHPSNDIDALSMEQVEKIFTGQITNWSEVGGPDEEIVVVVREDGSGTRATFEEIVHDDVDPSSEALQKPSNGAVKTTVGQTPYSIGYIGIGYLDDTVQPVKIDGVIPTEANVANGSYPISRLLYMITNGEPEGLTKAFINFVLSDEGQDIVAAEGFIKL
ncbi:phosphate ABC transporter substrate-binding protein [archaeon]|nr:MAG: phosphate ABC transporter substrate-binding protein [archaeon]